MGGSGATVFCPVLGILENATQMEQNHRNTRWETEPYVWDRQGTESVYRTGHGGAAD